MPRWTVLLPQPLKMFSPKTNGFSKYLLLCKLYEIRLQ